MSDPGIAGFLAAALGCSLGALLRFDISRRIVASLGDAFPWATLAVNLSGCLVAGFAATGAVAASSTGTAWMITGVLGGFTTVSSFGLETALLVQRGRAAGAIGYVSASLTGGLLATFAGAGLALGAFGHG